MDYFLYSPRLYHITTIKKFDFATGIVSKKINR
jgi:hypothetical protein